MTRLDPIAAILPGPTPTLRTKRDPEHQRDQHAGERHASGHKPPHEGHAAPGDHELTPVGLLVKA